MNLLLKRARALHPRKRAPHLRLQMAALVTKVPRALIQHLTPAAETRLVRTQEMELLRRMRLRQQGGTRVLKHRMHLTAERMATLATQFLAKQLRAPTVMAQLLPAIP